jgi:hypothetical protein
LTCVHADLCLKLADELPSFPPPAGADKPVSFRQILLNTCQDEFEGAENLRQVCIQAYVCLHVCVCVLRQVHVPVLGKQVPGSLLCVGGQRGSSRILAKAEAVTMASQSYLRPSDQDTFLKGGGALTGEEGVVRNSVKNSIVIKNCHIFCLAMLS